MHICFVGECGTGFAVLHRRLHKVCHSHAILVVCAVVCLYTAAGLAYPCHVMKVHGVIHCNCVVAQPLQ
jgi:hypothetical protein